jgi:DMSO/TMAO reductase YedYZ molybdopterin-dependent catalytic subunit
VAGGIAVAAITLGLCTDGVPVLALALWERTLRVIPMEVFAFFIVRLKFAAKPSAYWGMLGAATVLWGVFGAVLGARRIRPVLRAGAAWAVSVVVLGTVSFGPATQALEARRSAVGQVGSAAPGVLEAIALVALIYAVVFTLVSAAVERRPRPDGSDSTRAAGGGPSRTAAGTTRRELLRRALILGLAGTTGSAAARWLWAFSGRTTAFAQSLFTRIRGLPPEITPNDRFYVVSKNPPGFDPGVDGDKWLLQVGGLVGEPVRITYQQLRAMPAVEQLQTLECISNEVGGDLISNAKWKGVRLRDILARAGGPGAKAVKVAFQCADGYTESLPLGDAMNPTTLVVYEMNGEPLPKVHGFPARLLVPGLFGMKNPKWITRIDVVDYDFQGYWEKSGWSDEAVVKTMSKATTLPRTVPLGEVPVGGVAYAGDRGIKEVAYSVDGGKSWLNAEVKAPLGPFTWVLWAAVWTPAAPGEYTVKVRAKDGGGVLQSAKDTATLPDGASGYHTLRIRVRK